MLINDTTNIKADIEFCIKIDPHLEDEFLDRTLE